jgi:hypothetical protein
LAVFWPPRAVAVVDVEGCHGDINIARGRPISRPDGRSGGLGLRLALTAFIGGFPPIIDSKLVLLFLEFLREHVASEIQANTL